MKLARALVIVPYLLLATLPLGWLALTSLKSYEDTITTRAKFVPWSDTAEARSDDSVKFAASLDAYRSLSKPVAGTPRDFYHYLGNSLIIGGLSTLVAVCLGTLCAYGFSRFRIPGSKDWLFFILSTRFLPPLAVVVPVLVMYRRLSLENTHIGLILLYTSFNLSLAVWLMKGFMDEIPRAFEEAALRRRLLAPRGLRACDRPASGDRDGGDGGLLSHLVLERVRLRDDAQQLRSQDRAGVLRRPAGKHRWRALAADRGWDDDLRGADRAVHRAGAEAPAPGSDLWDDQAIAREAMADAGSSRSTGARWAAWFWGWRFT